ncbi:MAG: homocysteine S-methyltransferase family protein, partial [Burkholderiales bacterium]
MSDKRHQLLARLSDERILVLDGAMGTMIQGHRLASEHYHGDRFHHHHCDQTGNNDLLTLTQP